MIDSRNMQGLIKTQDSKYGHKKAGPMLTLLFPETNKTI
jgi:hypothetical protein